MGKAILFSAPSGCGKTTIINELMKYFDCFDFSISATSRAPRGSEQDGKDYYFLTHEEFKRRIDAGDFLEWEEVYQGTCYGTLKSEIERIWAAGRVIVFDVDVNGGSNIKRYFGSDNQTPRPQRRGAQEGSAVRCDDSERRPWPCSGRGPPCDRKVPR